MTPVYDNRFLEALDCAIGKIRLSPNHRFINIRQAQYQFPNRYLHLDLVPDETTVEQSIVRKKYTINMRALKQASDGRSHDLYLPIEGIDEALALARFSISNQKNISTAQLYNIASYASRTHNLWRMRYHSVTLDEQWISLNLQIDVNAGAILDLHKETLAKQEN